MPWFGDRAPRPVFLTLGNHRDFDRLASNKRTWFTRWAGATLGQETLLPEKATEDLYGLAITSLESREVFVRTTGPQGDSLAQQRHGAGFGAHFFRQVFDFRGARHQGGQVEAEGIFDFSATDHTGLDLHAFEMLTVKNGKFTIYRN